jgi:hypothetical protein
VLAKGSSSNQEAFYKDESNAGSDRDARIQAIARCRRAELQREEAQGRPWRLKDLPREP